MIFFRVPSFSFRYQGNGKIEDVHLFMKYLYRYWYYKGLWGSCLEAFVDFMNSCVVFVVILFLTTLFDWSAALTCDELTCLNASFVHGIHTPTVFGRGHAALGLVMLLSALASVCYEFVGLVETCMLEREIESMLDTVVDCGHPTPVHRFLYMWRHMQARAEGREEICLTGQRPFLGNMSWGSFLDRLCDHIQQDRSFGITAHREFDSLRAVQALMVYDNYIIALHQHGVLGRGSLKFADEALLKLIVSGVFDEFNTLSVGSDRESRVRWQLIRYLAFYVILYPLVVALSLTKALVKNAAQMRSGLDNYVARDWSNRARWSFRLYNEVPHILSARLILGRQTAVEMVRRLQPHSSCKRFLRRTCSAVVLVTVGLSFLNTALLIGGTFGGISLVWWLSIALLVFSMCCEPEPVQREYNYAQDLRKLVSQVHYGQSEWFYSGDTFYTSLTYEFLKTRFRLIVSDLARTIFMPFILLAILIDHSVPDIVSCIRSDSVRVDGLGSVARGSAFDMQTDDNENIDQKTGGAYFSAPFDEKCAMSVASFSSVYRRWSDKRMQAVEETGEAQPDASSARRSALGHFLAELRHRVNEEAPTVTTSLFSSHNTEESPAIDESSVSFQWQHVTAHEREQLFVSQVPMSFESTQFSRETRPVSYLGREGDVGACCSQFSHNYHATSGSKQGGV